MQVPRKRILLNREGNRVEYTWNNRFFVHTYPEMYIPPRLFEYGKNHIEETLRIHIEHLDARGLLQWTQLEGVSEPCCVPKDTIFREPFALYHEGNDMIYYYDIEVNRIR